MIDYGKTVPAEEAKVFTDDLIPGRAVPEQPKASTMGNALWSYLYEHTINGIPVAPEDRNLPITEDTLLKNSFVLRSVPRSSIFWLSPDTEEAIKDYDALLERSFNGEIMIVDELKQYDAVKGRFMVWIRYNEVEYALHERYKHLREDLDYV